MNDIIKSLTISDILKSTYVKMHKLIWITIYVSAVCTLQLSMAGCADERGWSKAESAIINEASAPMRVLTVNNPADSTVLRTPCTDLTPEMLASPEYAKLASLMVATVTDPSEDGVGIAGPQVGISRRIVAVQRFDKPGEPFEVYPNIRIIAVRGELCSGPEGCLSVPGRRGNVLRYRDIDIKYSLVPKSATGLDGSTETTAGSRTSEGAGAVRDTVERIQGFTAVIFQHECDHLDGVLYTDKLSDTP